jgi:hypothetical protein
MFLCRAKKLDDKSDETEVESSDGGDSDAGKSDASKKSKPSTSTETPQEARASKKSVDNDGKSKKQATLHNYSGPSRTYFPKAFINAAYAAIALFIASDLVPISIVEGVGFTAMINVLLGSHFPVPKRDKIMTFLRGLRDTSKQEILDKLKLADRVNLTTDYWTSKAGDSYITATCYYIDDDWKLVKHTLFTCSMADRHTHLNLINKLETKLEEWGIIKKILSTTSDNAANILKDVKQSNSLGESNGCFAHKIHLCVMNLFKNNDLCKLLKKCTRLAGHFKHSSIASTGLVEKQKESSIEENKLVQGVKTRWNSYVNIFQSLIKNKVAIYAVLHDNNYTTHKMANKLEIRFIINFY